MSHKQNGVSWQGPLKLMAVAAAVLAMAGTASAQATNAGETVSNTFTLNYDVNDTPQPQIDNEDGTPGDPDGPTIFTVDRVIDVTVAATNSPRDVAPGTLATDPNVALTFDVTNTGNDRQSYSFSIEDLTTDFSFVPGTQVITYTIPALPAVPATGSTPAIPATSEVTGTITPVAVGTANGLTAGTQFTPDIPAGTTFVVTITGEIPDTAANAEIEDLVLVAETRDPEFWSVEGATGTDGDLTTGVNFEGATATANVLTGAAQNVFRDSAGDGADTALNGRNADTGRYIIATPNVTGVKTVEVVSTDGTNCSDFTFTPATPQFATPGACVEYIITVTNLGADDPAGDPIPGDDIPATNIVVADILPDELVYIAATAEDFAIAPAPSAGQPLPAANDVCDGTAGTCLVRFEGGTVTAPGNTGIPLGSGAAPTEARIRIRALVQ